ncbi:MAG: hypothetical protein PF513_01305 [Tenericutes bacterium]|nr:hypothetical protein [Mycoplasmatota bacterium]
MDQLGMQGDCITNDLNLGEIYEEYNLYISPAYWCHCHSFVSNFSDKSYDSYNILETFGTRKNVEDFTFEGEFNLLYSFITSVVENYGEIKFFSFWNDNRIPQINKKRNIKIKQLTFDLLARLEYLELLCITE